MWTKQEKTDYMNCREKDGCMLLMVLKRTSVQGTGLLSLTCYRGRRKIINYLGQDV